MRITAARLMAGFVVGAVGGIGACSDDEPGAPSNPLVGTWSATSLLIQGANLIALGMDLRLTLTEGGTYTLVVEGDLTGLCDGMSGCTETGPYTSTASQITLNPGTNDALTLGWMIQGQTLTFTGAIGADPVTITLTRT